MGPKLGVHWLRMFSLAPWSNIPFKSTLFGWWKTSLITPTHFDPIWAFYPLVRGTWVQNLGLTGSECVPWLLDKRFHSNPPSFYYEKPALVHLPILGLSPPGTGDLGTKFRVNLEIRPPDGTFLLCIENGAFVTNWNTFFHYSLY